MKKLAVLFALTTISAMAAEWTGYIIDTSCASKKENSGTEDFNHNCRTGLALRASVPTT